MTLVAMGRRLALLAAMMAIAIIAGCTTDRKVYEGGDGGFVVASVAVRSDTPYAAVRLDFRRRGGAEAGHVFWVSDSDPLAIGAKADFKGPEGNGIVGSVRLAPGDYEFYNFVAHMNTVDYSAKNDFSIPFTVTANGITYLGSYSFAALWTRGLLITEWPTRPMISISNQQARDIAIFTSRVPEGAGMTVRTSVPDPRTLALPFFPPVAPPIHQQ